MTILRMTAVMAETGHRSPASIYQAIKAGLFTRQVRVGMRAVGWPAGEVHAINAARAAGKAESEIRALVNRLHAGRAHIAGACQ
jgi:prophage regulatory protein